MKKIIALFLLLTLCSCSSGKAVKVDKDLLNKFPSDAKVLINECNPDVVSINYMNKHIEDYSVDLTGDRNDFLVIVKGTVTKLEYENNNDVLDRLKEHGIDTTTSEKLLKDTISIDVYLDDCEKPLTDTIDNKSTYNLKEGHEYYFFVCVTDPIYEGDSYSTSITTYYNLD